MSSNLLLNLVQSENVEEVGKFLEDNPTFNVNEDLSDDYG
jgi:hypothetical protein